MNHRRRILLAAMIAAVLAAASSPQLAANEPDGATLPEVFPAKIRGKLRAGEPVRIVCFGDSVTGVYYHTGSRRAYTDMLGIAIRRRVPRARVEMINAGISGHTTIERDAEGRVREMKPDLVLLAVPRSAASPSDEQFEKSYGWIMNWSLNFGAPTWDCIVVHPSVVDPQAKEQPRDRLVRRLVRAQDLSLVDRTPGNSDDAADILRDWFRGQGK